MVGLQLDRQELTRAWVRGMYETEKPEEYLEARTEAVLAIPTNSAITLLANLMLMEERDQRPVVDDLDRPVLLVTCSQRWTIALAEEPCQRWPHIRGETLERTVTPSSRTSQNASTKCWNSSWQPCQ
ncbi:MAG: hypothetical protein PVJ76_11005 [Gemmatimonadota bacterium]|jgi:hypothetical protein